MMFLLTSPTTTVRHIRSAMPFLVSESEFVEIFGRIQERDLPYWADPFKACQVGSTQTTEAAGVCWG